MCSLLQLQPSPCYSTGLVSFPSTRSPSSCIRSKLDDTSKDNGYGDPSSAPSIADLKLALGIQKNPPPPPPLLPKLRDLKRLPSTQQKEDEEEEEEFPVLQTICDWLTENVEAQATQERSLQFILLSLPIWLLYLSVAAGFIELPFNLPFLEK